MRSTPPELARSALDAAPDAIIIIDSGGIIRFANRQVSALFGHEHDEIIGWSIEALMPDRFRELHVGHRQSYMHNFRVRPMGVGLDLFARRKDGSEFPVEISLSPIEDGDSVLVVAAIRDCTERTRAKAELIAARQAAERARAAADESREFAERANQGKSRFLATASHDLRQPLQSLALLNGSLRRLVSDPEALEALSQQDLAIGAMTRLLNALLDISKLESGAINPEVTDFSVAGIFEELRHEFTGIAARKGLELQIEPSCCSAHSDPSLIEQILRNLVSNAIKYTPKGYVRLRSLPEQTGSIRLEVMDTGIGIAEDALPFIYDEFYQVGVPANSTRDGYGLGLSIVQRLVKLLKLRLDVHSEIGKGSVFALTLPGSPAAARSQQTVAGNQPAAPARQSSQVHVLLLDDDRAVLNATRMLFKVEGYRVTAVSSLSEAVAAVRADPSVDLLVTDFHLGKGETGMQVISALREILGKPVKTVLLTGDTSTAMRSLSLDSTTRIASKPVHAEELLKLSNALLRDTAQC